MGLSANGAAVNMGHMSRAGTRLNNMLLCHVSVHYNADRLELAIKTISKSVAYFKTLEDTLKEFCRL